MLTSTAADISKVNQWTRYEEIQKKQSTPDEDISTDSSL